MKEKLVQKIANINGLRPTACKFNEVEQIVKADDDVVSSDFLRYQALLNKYVVSADTDLVDSQKRFDRLSFERLTRLRQYWQAINGERNNAFYGQTAMSYLFGLFSMRQEGALPVGSKSLLVGAISKDSLDQFKFTMDLADPKAETYCVDIAGEEIREPNTFVFGDAFSLPFKDGSFDTVHTHKLVDYMELMKEWGKIGDFDPMQFYTEVFRVLKPGGGFLRVEREHTDIAMLRKCGFTIHMHEPSHIFKDDAVTYAFFDHDASVTSRGAQGLKDLTETGFNTFVLARKPALPVEEQTMWVNNGKTTWAGKLQKNTV